MIRATQSTMLIQR